MVSSSSAGSSSNPNTKNPATGAGSSSPGSRSLYQDENYTPQYVDPDQQNEMMEHPGTENDHIEDDIDDSPDVCDCENNAPSGAIKCTDSRIIFLKEWQNCIQPSLCTILIAVADALGRNLTINSGWRCQAYNRRIGGARNSQHLYGNAADVSTSGFSTADKIMMLDVALSNGIGGIQIYSSFIHMDIGSRRVWKSTPSWARATYEQYSYPV